MEGSDKLILSIVTHSLMGGQMLKLSSEYLVGNTVLGIAPGILLYCVTQRKW